MAGLVAQKTAELEEARLDLPRAQRTWRKTATRLGPIDSENQDERVREAFERSGLAVMKATGVFCLASRTMGRQGSRAPRPPGETSDPAWSKQTQG